MPNGPVACEWIGLSDALSRFASNAAGTQGAAHIRPLHWYVACRLVIEGGFDPDDITPRPPLVVRTRGQRRILRVRPDHRAGRRAHHPRWAEDEGRGRGRDQEWHRTSHRGLDEGNRWGVPQPD